MASEVATVSTISATFFIAAEQPRSGGGAATESMLFRSRTFSARSERCSAARLTSSDRSSGSNGLTM